MPTIGHRLKALAATHGSRPALRSGDSLLSFADLAADARRVAAALAALGVGKGTRVGILMPNRPDWLRCAFGAWRLGAIVVPLNTLYRGPELHHALLHADVTVLITVGRFLRNHYLTMLVELCPELTHQAGAALRSAALPALRRVICDGDDLPRAVLAWEDFLARGEPGSTPWSVAALDAVAPTDDAAIFFTSGSTAAPKGVVHTHASMLAGADNVAERLGLDADDVTYGYLPLFFNGGLVGVTLATLTRGASVLLQEVFDAEETLALLERHRATTLFAWPHQAEALLRHPHFDRQRLQLRKGPGANTKWAAALFQPDHQAVGAWGMTETGPMAACARWDDAAADRAGAHGRPMPGLDLRIVDPDTNQPLPVGSEGEIAVRGASLMRTYYRCEARDCFDAEGYFHTGDCGRLDARGWLHFVGRLKDVIKTAGVNVAAAEVEATLLRHPAVKVAHVVPVPHPTRGENVGAFIVRRDPTCSASDLQAHCRASLATYKVPRHVFFVAEAELPTLGSGKVDRQRLRAAAAEMVGDSDPAE
ncbi:MAG: class I adenylate-forming enzyme family protein [Deltaproteobacteria bacterium]|nr:class I adenylate-forming enzyme family protein [Deltaproteobacteria bacterium]